MFPVQSAFSAPYGPNALDALVAADPRLSGLFGQWPPNPLPVPAAVVPTAPVGVPEAPPKLTDKGRSPLPEGIDQHPRTLRFEAGERTFDVRSFMDDAAGRVHCIHMVDLLRVACAFPSVAALPGVDKTSVKQADPATGALNVIERTDGTFFGILWYSLIFVPCRLR